MRPEAFLNKKINKKIGLRSGRSFCENGKSFDGVDLHLKYVTVVGFFGNGTVKKKRTPALYSRSADCCFRPSPYSICQRALPFTFCLSVNLLLPFEH